MYFRGLLLNSCGIGTNYYCCGLIAEALSFRSVPSCSLPQGALLRSALGVSVGLLTESVEYEPYGYSVFSQYLKR